MAYERNLVLVHTRALQARSDFETIQAKLAVRAPDIEVFIVNNDISNSVTRRHAATRPALIFSPIPLRAFTPRRGKILAGRGLPKWTEIERLVAAGVPVPEAVILRPGMTFDPAVWGPFMIVKPSRGMQGSGVILHRTRDVRWRDPRSFPPNDPRHGVDLIAQRFVDTGLNTNHTRVMTVLGRPVYSTMSRWVAPRAFALDPDGSEPIDQPIAANTGERTVTLRYNEEFMAFAEEAARVFPDVPVLGIDMVRDVTTGLIYALEVNAGGKTWHISSNYGVEMQKVRGIDLQTQLDALDVIADAMIDHTRRYAE